MPNEGKTPRKLRLHGAPSEHAAQPNLLRAILTDVQFWIPLAVLALGVVLLVFIHNN